MDRSNEEIFALFVVGVIFVVLTGALMVVVIKDYLIETGRLSKHYRLPMTEYSEGPPLTEYDKYDYRNQPRLISVKGRYVFCLVTMFIFVFTLIKMEFWSICAKVYEIWL